MSYANKKDIGYMGDRARGASMGQDQFGDISEVPDKSVNLARVALDSGGYAPGGIYWGASSPGEHLYCAEAEVDGETVFVRFVRAATRGKAIAKLEIPREKLKKP